MSIVVFYLGADQHTSSAEMFRGDQLLEALSRTETLRREGMQHVCISTQLDGAVGKAGVDTVNDGKTPDGQAYEWSKQHRGGQRL